MNATLPELKNAIRSLKGQHKTAWLQFNAKVQSALSALGERMGVAWTSEEDITDHVTAADFMAAGFSAGEAEAMIFVLTQDCMGQAVISTEMIERWFCYCV